MDVGKNLYKRQIDSLLYYKPLVCYEVARLWPSMVASPTPMSAKPIS
jgi:hypothetical protein